MTLTFPNIAQFSFLIRTVAALEADTRLGYSSAPFIVAPGDVVLVLATGQGYTVVASDVAGDVATAGGVQLDETSPAAVPPPPTQDQSHWNAGTGTTESLITAAKLKATILANAPAPVLVGPIATTSGTAFDVENIPAWANEITFLANRVSTTSTNVPLLRLGTASEFAATGYSARVGGATFTTGFPLFGSSASDERIARWTFYKVGNAWWGDFDTLFSLAASASATGVGFIDLGAPLTRLRLLTGGDTFDLGSFSVRYSA